MILLLSTIRWWEVEELVRKLFLSAVVVLIEPGSPLQVLLVIRADCLVIMMLVVAVVRLQVSISDGGTTAAANLSQTRNILRLSLALALADYAGGASQQLGPRPSLRV